MQSPTFRSEQIQLRKDTATIYTILGIIWAGVALFSVPPTLKGFVLVGIAVPVLLLLARWIKIQQESLDIQANWEPIGSDVRPGLNRHAFLALSLGVFAAILITAFGLAILGKREWIAPSAAILFAIHFYLLPPAISMWEDVLIASATAVVAIVTPFWFPAQFWLWWLVASSACALASWLAADLRYQDALVLQEAERRDLDRAAFNP